LWAKKDEDSLSGHALAAWSLVCRPKHHGGLGIKNIELHNKAYLLKQLHKFFCKEDTPWVKLVWSLYEQGAPHAQTPRGSFWWRDICSFIGDYRSITTVHIGNGDSTLFWKDFWSKGGTLCDQFPCLFSYTLHEDSTVADLALSPNLSSQFALPLSVEAYRKFIQVHELLSAITIMPKTLDARRFVWGNTVYTSAKFYEFLFWQF
jgi:hypothetical protein